MRVFAATLGSVILVAALIEGGSRIWLAFDGDFNPPSAADYARRPESKFEWPESLSAFPIHQPDRGWPHKNSVTEITPVIHSDGVWMPPRGEKLVIDVVENIEKKSLRRITVTTDEHARRIAPWHEDSLKTARKHVAFFGDELAWGYGVNDRETIAAQLSENEPGLVTYNLAYTDYGISELLIRAQDGDSLFDIKPKQGAGVYLVSASQVDRFLNSALMLSAGRREGLSLKETDPGVFRSQGPVDQAKPLWHEIAPIITYSGFARLTQFDWPMHTLANLNQFVRAVKALREQYWRNTLPTNPFVVVLLPSPSRDLRRLRAALNRGEVNFIDYSQVNVPSRLRGRFARPGELHPEPEALGLFAKALKKDLKL